MDISWPQAVEKLITWEAGSRRLLVEFRCEAGTLAAITDDFEISEDSLTLTLILSNGRLSISLETAKFEEGTPILIPSSRLASPVLDWLILRFSPNSYCKLTEMPTHQEEWPKSITDLVQ